jgi:hypothetical protein
MPKDEMKDALNRVLTWPEEDQDKVARFIEQVEEWRSMDELVIDDVSVIEERAAK